MRLKKYNEYVNEELTPMAGELDKVSEEIPMVDELDETTLEETPMGETQLESDEEEGQDVDSWKGDQFLQQFAEMMGSEVTNNQVDINGQIVTFAPETNTFLINRKNTKISDPHELVHKEFKGHDHSH